MNANELADELVWIAKNRGDSVSRQLADIVRQQQAEIEALKAENEKLFTTMLDMALDEELRTLKRKQNE